MKEKKKRGWKVTKPKSRGKKGTSLVWTPLKKLMVTAHDKETLVFRRAFSTDQEQRVTLALSCALQWNSVHVVFVIRWQLRNHSPRNALEVKLCSLIFQINWYHMIYRTNHVGRVHLQIMIRSKSFRDFNFLCDSRLIFIFFKLFRSHMLECKLLIIRFHASVCICSSFCF